jgi:DNA-binding CsgD family transcriptional regulator
MTILLTPLDQSAIRRLLLAESDPVNVLSVDAATAVLQLVPCDLLYSGEGDANGYLLRGVDYPDGRYDDVGMQVCDGPLQTGLHYRAMLPPDDSELATDRERGFTDWIRLGFSTATATVILLGVVRRHGHFTARDVALLTMLEPALGRVVRLSSAIPSSAPLTAAERRVLELVSRGASNQEAAEELFVSVATVRKHLENAYRKLGVRSRTAAVASLAAAG